MVTNDLKRYERLKLFILNLGHTWLAEIWRRRNGAPAMTVREAMADEAMVSELGDLYEKEVLPVFAGDRNGEGGATPIETRSSTGSAIPFSITASPKSSSTTKPRSSAASAD